MHDEKKLLARAAYHCARCGKEAAILELFARETDPDDKYGGTLVTSGYIGQAEEVVMRDGLTALENAISSGVPSRLHESHAPFYCPECRKCYCIDHWRCEVRYDDEFYDCTYGTCPEGHRRMIDD